MSEYRYASLTRAAAATVTALTLVVGSGSAFGAMINWKGVSFETQGNGTAVVDSNDDLLLTPDSDAAFGVHVNRLPGGGNGPSPINANGTPFISFSFLDTGIAGQNIDFAIQDETATGQPRIAAGSLFGATQTAVATYGTGAERSTNEQYLFYTTPRDAVSHDVVLGKTADSTIFATFDGEQRSSDIFKNAGIDFDFNDVALRARGASGSTIRFTDLAFGDNFSPASAQDVPEPGSLAILGLGALLMMMFGMRQRRS
ncbi:PEP-CTERM sorting domain-containing protein [Salinisphaera aquimarina]|uniref:PEP-CTERM sorting domain-containing protein n=1 Tax=Salinisphaera aquimarina TaxID=2094031 RepID=A0ABV7ELD7_9GAMM